MEVLSKTLGLMSAAASLAGHRVEWNALPLEGGTDPAFGTVRWRTIFDAKTTPGTSEMVVGIAEFGPGGILPPHRHAPPEVYLGLEGEAVVTISGVACPISSGVALFVPGYAEHGTIAGPAGARFLYVFPRDQFEQVHYEFAPFQPMAF